MIEKQNKNNKTKEKRKDIMVHSKMENMKLDQQGSSMFCYHRTKFKVAILCSISQEFTDEIQALEPQFVQVMNDGNQLLRNEALNEPEKAQIYAELQEIERKYEGVKDDISQELNR